MARWLPWATTSCRYPTTRTLSRSASTPRKSRSALRILPTFSTPTFLHALTLLCRGISVVATKGQLKVKGRLHDKGDIPFETQGVMLQRPTEEFDCTAKKSKLCMCR